MVAGQEPDPGDQRRRPEAEQRGQEGRPDGAEGGKRRHQVSGGRGGVVAGHQPLREVESPAGFQRGDCWGGVPFSWWVGVGTRQDGVDRCGEVQPPVQQKKKDLVVLAEEGALKGPGLATTQSAAGPLGWRECGGRSAHCTGASVSKVRTVPRGLLPLAWVAGDWKMAQVLMGDRRGTRGLEGPWGCLQEPRRDVQLGRRQTNLWSQKGVC